MPPMKGQSFVSSHLHSHDNTALQTARDPVGRVTEGAVWACSFDLALVMASRGRRQGLWLHMSLEVPFLRTLANPGHLPKAPTCEHHSGSCFYPLTPHNKDYISTSESLAGTLKPCPPQSVVPIPWIIILSRFSVQFSFMVVFGSWN